jgi:hypothetical protein
VLCARSIKPLSGTWDKLTAPKNYFVICFCHAMGLWIPVTAFAAESPPRFQIAPGQTDSPAMSLAEENTVSLTS